MISLLSLLIAQQLKLLRSSFNDLSTLVKIDEKYLSHYDKNHLQLFKNKLESIFLLHKKCEK